MVSIARGRIAMKPRMTAAGIVAATVLLAMTSLASLAAGPFEGVWRVQDSSGKPMEITLSDGGKAAANRHGMSGTWSEEGNAAVIKWNTGWTTKIEKEGDHYRHVAYSKGQSPSGPPHNSSDAERVR
jgi:hypothetical protein